jgi:hypothetical protein
LAFLARLRSLSFDKFERASVRNLVPHNLGRTSGLVEIARSSYHLRAVSAKSSEVQPSCPSLSIIEELRERIRRLEGASRHSAR